MKRRLIRQGANTLTVSLPKKWVERTGLTDKDEVEIDEQANSLIITSEAKPKLRKLKVNLKDYEGLTKRLIASIYRAGYDEVEFTFDDPKDLKDIEEVLNVLSSFEITKMDKNSCKITSLSEIGEKEFDVLLRRTIYLVKVAFNDLYEGLKDNDENKIKTLLKYEVINNKLTLLCRRYLSREGFRDLKKTGILYTICEQLENLLDAVRDIAKEILKISLKPTKSTLELYHSLSNFASDFTKYASELDVNIVSKTGVIRERILSRSFALFGKTRSQDLLLFRTVQLATRIADLGGPFLTYHI